MAIMKKILIKVSVKHWKSCTKFFFLIKKITGNFLEHTKIFEKMLRNLCLSYKKFFSFFFFLLHRKRF